MAGKVIITCAVTGAIHTPSMSDHLPITPEEIARSSIEAAEAGAAIIHLHARDPQTGEPTPDPAVFMRFLPVIKQSTDAVVNITTGGGLNMTLDDRLAAPLLAKPEMCSLNMGSMNFNISRAGDRVKTWKHRLGEARPRPHRRSHLPQHVPRHRRYRRASGQGARHALRIRMLRCWPSVQSGLLPGAEDRRAAAVRADDLRHPGRHRRRSAQPAVHARRRRTSCSATPMSGRCWQRGAIRWRSPPWPAFWGQCACRTRGQPVHWSRCAGAIERRAGGEDPPHSGGAEPGNRDAEGSARISQVEGW